MDFFDVPFLVLHCGVVIPTNGAIIRSTVVMTKVVVLQIATFVENLIAAIVHALEISLDSLRTWFCDLYYSMLVVRYILVVLPFAQTKSQFVAMLEFASEFRIFL